jgi:HK97 family phage portal protein
MGFFDRFRNYISKNAQQTNIDFNRAIYNFLGDSIVWNPENDDTYINKGYRFNSTIYSIINLITKTASTIPFMVYEVKNDNELKRYKSMTSGNFNSNAMLQSKILQKKALVEIEDTELHELLSRPNPAQSYNAWLQEIVAFGKLTGNRYIYGISPESGANQNKFQELYVLPSQSVEINSGGIFDPVKYYTLDYNGEYKIDAEDVCHIKDFNPYYDGTGSHLYGMSPLKAGLRSLDANNEALTTGVRYLQNQTARGVLSSEEGDLNEVQAKQLKEKFKQQYQGSNNAGDVIITPKKLSWVNFGLNASDLSLIEQYNASIKDLCNIYNVPVQLLNNTDSSTYNNMNEAKKSLYVNAVIPELNKVKDELNRWLTPSFGEKLYIDFDYTNIPELQEEMDKVVGQMTQAWWLTPNEKRAAMSYGADDDTPEMNDYYIPSQFIPLDNQDFVVEEEPKSVNIDFQSLMKQEIKKEDIQVETKQESYNNYPQGATNNARRMLEWREKYGRDVVQGGTRVGWERANQLANREALSLETVKRVHSFLSRHKGNEVIADEYKDEPWKDKGYVAYNLWGGKAMVSWAKRISENEESDN